MSEIKIWPVEEMVNQNESTDWMTRSCFTHANA